MNRLDLFRRLFSTMAQEKNYGFAGPIGASIREKLSQSLSPSHLEIFNESHMHSVPRNSETHFKLVIVSDAFQGKSLLERHRFVFGILKDELQNGVHALSIAKACTSEQWERDQNVAKSPACLGGSKHG
eukprot:TRINITY_DN5075_c0_g2_i5.p1 TRINITY_DN5075_c0_g2~~TRINITY_DN5075_c0_g2_i5.p1  ORF type:complete len:129 (-),score=1.72 TRINITY_DN5075_c0_g2_i5:185-571(-)